MLLQAIVNKRKLKKKKIKKEINEKASSKLETREVCNQIIMNIKA